MDVFDIALFELTAGLTTPWPNCNFCGWGGVGWGGVGMMTFFELEHMVDATQLCLSCNCTHGGCYATVLVLSLHTWWMLRNCACLVIAHMVIARAWKSESKRLRLRFKNVAHCKMQFSKLVRVRGLPKLTGTQCLDQTWKQLKRYIPKELRSRDQTTRRDNHRLEEYVWSFLFRMNVRPKLLEALGKLAQKANNATR